MPLFQGRLLRARAVSLRLMTSLNKRSPERLQIVMPYLHTLFDGTEPSLTGVGVAALAGPNLQLEIEMVARLQS